MELTGVEVSAYERVSKDVSGRERSPEEQHDRHLITCDRFSWTLQLPTYREVGSASKHQRKARAKFDQLLADLKSGRFTAKVLMLYSSSRGSRQTEEWLMLINLCTERNVVFWVDQHDRVYDPRKPRDRKQLIDDASKSELDVAEMSQAIKRTTAASALRGLPHGRLPFGYKRLYDPRTRKFVSQEPDPVEGPIVQEMYARVRKGHSLKGIARDLNARGLHRRGGGDWVPQNIALLLLRETYIGVRVHDPERKTPYHPLTPDAVVVPGAWERLVTPEIFYSVKRILRDPSRMTNERPGAIVHFMSGIAVCDTCSEVLRVCRKSGLWRYTCVKNGCVTIAEDGLDDFVDEVLLEYLSVPERYAELTAGDGAADAELVTVRDELEEQRSELKELQEGVEAGDIKVKFARATAPGMEKRIAQLEIRERELMVPSQLVGLIEPGPGVRGRWIASELSTRRAVARILLSRTGLIGELRVKPIGPGRRKVPIIEGRVRFERDESVGG